MAEVRPSFFDFDVTKMMTDFHFRPFDVEALMACQRRNIEALSQANQLAVEGVQAVTRRQIEIARQALEGVSALFSDMAQPSSTEDRIAKNAEFAKQMLEKSVATAARSPNWQPRPAPRRRRPAQARERKPRRAARDGEAARAALSPRRAVSEGRAGHDRGGLCTRPAAHYRGRWRRARSPP